jgi:hypothetical protein
MNIRWNAAWYSKINNYYAKACEYLEWNNGKPKYKIWYLHRIVTNAPKGSYVDHINHNTLDNRKSNLRVTTQNINLQNRLGGNSNNKTGVRNVHWINREQKYFVQIMKDYKSYKWVFEADQFKEACEFAEKKRKELYGEI